MVVGAITGWDILSHPIITIRCFGWKVFFKALFTGQDRTFLSLLPATFLRGQSTSRLSDLVDRCIDLELKAKRFYLAFSRVFFDFPRARQFFMELSSQEQEHADLLAVCRAAASKAGWSEKVQHPWEKYIDYLEEHFNQIEAALPEISSLEDALQLVVQIESAEINQVFRGVLSANNSDFVKRVSAFRRAVEIHITFIEDQLPKLAPRFALTARKMFASFPHPR